ncbi:phage tail-collar fiber domain-containing protein [Xenorhabdus stockiae]|uniref:phage tail-collar fiber domain-containing protein n=1 Tax=Xenorhabdus stockiae TaxID=351614 RepID=UPI0040647FBC
MSSVITTDFERWKAQQVAAGQPVVLDEFVFAYVPDLDPTQTLSRDEGLPAVNQIVHRQAVNKTGLASENAVAYSVTLGTEVGNFDFNWIGLINQASGVIGMITHAPIQKKIRTANGLQGNVLTRSFLLEFEGAATETAITTTAETWQIDFTARLSGMDEMQRLMNTDCYGEAAFFEEGFAVIRNGEQYTVKKGLAYVGGLRGGLEFDQTLNYMRNTRVYADFSYQGNLMSQWKTVVKITVADELDNYIDAAGYQHYVFAFARIDHQGDVIDLRSKGTFSDRDIAAIQNTLHNVKREYATVFALNQVDHNADSRLEKSKNGTDIPNKMAFVENLGLANTVELAQNAVPKTAITQYSGDSPNHVMSQSTATKFLNEKLDKTGGQITANDRFLVLQNQSDNAANYIEAMDVNGNIRYRLGCMSSGSALQLVNIAGKTVLSLHDSAVYINGTKAATVSDTESVLSVVKTKLDKTGGPITTDNRFLVLQNQSDNTANYIEAVDSRGNIRYRLGCMHEGNELKLANVAGKTTLSIRDSAIYINGTKAATVSDIESVLSAVKTKLDKTGGQIITDNRFLVLKNQSDSSANYIEAVDDKGNIRYRLGCMNSGSALTLVNVAGKTTLAIQDSALYVNGDKVATEETVKENYTSKIRLLFSREIEAGKGSFRELYDGEVITGVRGSPNDKFYEARNIRLHYVQYLVGNEWKTAKNA